jgi:hypothetical protein
VIFLQMMMRFMNNHYFCFVALHLMPGIFAPMHRTTVLYRCRMLASCGRENVRVRSPLAQQAVRYAVINQRWYRYR